MKKIIVSWIGGHDLNAVENGHPGPVFAALRAALDGRRPYHSARLLYNYPKEDVLPYQEWLAAKVGDAIDLSFESVQLTSPTNYAEIYPVALRTLQELTEHYPTSQLVIHLSPGTPAMAAVWILLVKTRFPAVCIESWRDNKGGQHVRDVELPFEIHARFLQEAVGRSDKRLSALHENTETSSFSRVIGGEGIEDALAKSRKIALRDVPVLLLGESGTGKEVFAQAIHGASQRAAGPFIAVNCGALPRELAESLLFGHKKGAFTGAVSDHAGFFAEANGGTLFLDEIGELPLDLQAKLLRALQEKQFVPVGGSKLATSDFRLIAATHRDLMRQISEGQFREDLFYRIAVGVIKIPPLRHRGEDIAILTEAMLADINEELADQPGYTRKSVNSSAKKLIANLPWRGNVRELRATLLRAAVWSDEATLTAKDIDDASVSLPSVEKTILANELTQPIDITNVLSEVVRHYIPLAMKATGGNKTRAASLLGLKSHQVLSDWIKKYEIDG